MAGKRVLVIGFSQSGQLQRVLDQVLVPLEKAGIVKISRHSLVCCHPYPFPWPFWQFLDAMPETVLGIAREIEPLRLEPDSAFDLVILGYPVWFLALPPPLVAFLESDAARVLRGRPVVTVIACRNMWITAQESMKAHLARLGARHLDQVVLTDQSGALASFVTTPRWMFTGRREAFWLFPAAGVAQSDIEASVRFGAGLADALASDRERGTQPLLSGLDACRVDERLIASERAGARSFRVWATLLHACGEPGGALRRLMLAVYALFLVCLIASVVPVTMIVNALLRPLRRAQLATLRRRYEAPSGSGTERLSHYRADEAHG